MSSMQMRSPEELVHDAGVGNLVARLVRGNGTAQLAQHLGTEEVRWEWGVSAHARHTARGQVSTLLHPLA